MKIKLLSTILALLYLVVTCTIPNYRPTTDEDFQILLDNSKSHSEIYPDSALMILHELLPQQQTEEQKRNRAQVMNLIGVAYDTKGMYDSAAYYLYEASRLAEEIRDDSLLISVYTNLGILQFEMNNAEEAIQYHKQALDAGRKINNSKTITHSLNNIGNTYMTLLNDYETAIPYFEQCMEISERTDYPTAYKVAGINLAEIYVEMGELDKALNELERITEQYGSNIYADHNMGVIYFKKGIYRKAIDTFKELLKKPLNTRKFELAILNNLANVYKESGNSDSAVVYLEKSYALHDSLHNIQSTETIQNLKIAYETEKKELAIMVLEDEKKLLSWLSVTVFFLLLAGMTSLFFLWRWTKQKKQLAEQQVIKLEQEKQLIATQAVLDGEIQERTRLARDLHDGLGCLLSAAKYNFSNFRKGSVLDAGNPEHFDKALKLLDESMREMHRVAHHLMPETLSNYGLNKSIADFCNSIPHAKFIWFGDETRFDPKMEVMVYRIMHELVSNALKHASASHILVQIVKENGHIDLTVQDDGCGFDPSAISKGMGLVNIRARIAAYCGSLLVDSQLGVGTEVKVEFHVQAC